MLRSAPGPWLRLQNACDFPVARAPAAASDLMFGVGPWVLTPAPESPGISWETAVSFVLSK